jgi:hypothetical protein
MSELYIFLASTNHRVENFRVPVVITPELKLGNI